MAKLEIKKPMTIDEVINLKPIKAQVAEKPADLNKIMDIKPEMEIINGFKLLKGTTSIQVEPNKSLTKLLETDHFIPAFVNFEPQPKLEEKKDATPAYIDRNTFFKDHGAKTIFGIDQRKVYYSTAYPWRCVGRVDTAIGPASGVMIGPRHLLTCGHVIDWKANNKTGWIKFTPMYYNGATPYGSAYGKLTYYKYKVSPPTIDSTESQYDYVVVVLDRAIGNNTGWMGAKAYTDAWDGKPYWTHAGYPGDLTGCQRPIYQTNIALDGDDRITDQHQPIYHKGDIWPGQSGGPFWAYWNGAPYVVATQSAHNPSINIASGGGDLLDLVVRARREHP